MSEWEVMKTHNKTDKEVEGRDKVNTEGSSACWVSRANENSDTNT